MNDREAEQVLGALADVPYPWMQPGAVFTAVHSGGYRYGGRVLSRAGDEVFVEADGVRTILASALGKSAEEVEAPCLTLDLRTAAPGFYVPGGA